MLDLLGTFDVHGVLNPTQSAPAVQNVFCKNLNPKMNIKMSDYPSFNGKRQDWTKFYKKLMAIAEIQGLSHFLEVDLSHDNDFWMDSDYQEECKILFSILKKCYASGFTLPKTDCYKST